MRIPRHGVVEIETLRRYGRVPVGTRGVGTFALWAKPTPPGQRRFEFLQAFVQVGDDPRIVGMNLIGDFTSDGDGARTWHTSHRRKIQAFHAEDLSGYLFQTVTNHFEDESNGTGAQRFKVVRIEWRDEDPLPRWVVDNMKAFGVVYAEGR